MEISSLTVKEFLTTPDMQKSLVTAFLDDQKSRTSLRDVT